MSTALGAIPSAAEDFSDHTADHDPLHMGGNLTHLQLLILSMLEDLEDLLVDDAVLPTGMQHDELTRAALNLIDGYHAGEIDPALSPSEAGSWALLARDAEFAVGHPECEFDPSVLIMLQDVLDALSTDLQDKAGGD